jgi:hypothetical protein
MDAYYSQVCKLKAKFYGHEFYHILRDYNMVADVLSKLGTRCALVPAGVFVQALQSPMVKTKEEPPTKPDLVHAEGQEVLIIKPDWKTPVDKCAKI